MRRYADQIDSPDQGRPVREDPDDSHHTKLISDSLHQPHMCQAHLVTREETVALLSRREGQTLLMTPVMCVGVVTRQILISLFCWLHLFVYVFSPYSANTGLKRSGAEKICQSEETDAKDNPL